MRIRTVKKAKQLIKRALAATLCLTMALPVMPAMAAPGGVIVSPKVPHGFLFEPESPVSSLKEEAQWNELEQLLDNPYVVTTDPATPGNDQGWSSYRTDPAQGFQRRRSFLPAGCTYLNPVPAGLSACNDALLPQFFVHPLNYNPTVGEEMRLINPNYGGGTFTIPDTNPPVANFGGLVDTGTTFTGPHPVTGVPTTGELYEWHYKTISVSDGATRFAGREDEAAIDYNSPMAPQLDVCRAATRSRGPRCTSPRPRRCELTGFASAGTIARLSAGPFRHPG